MQTVELFSGTKSFSKVAQELGHNTFTVDVEPKLNPDLVMDILELKRDQLPKVVNVLWMSPPCQTFSVASLRHYWENGKPKNDKTLKGLEIMRAALRIKDELLKDNPGMVWFMENPRAMMRKQIEVQKYRRVTVTYCSYGADVQKATDIWTNSSTWFPKKMCSPCSPCHQRAPRGSKFGVQGVKKNSFESKKYRYSLHNQVMLTGRLGGGDLKTSLLRGMIPPKLFYEIFRSIKK